MFEKINSIKINRVVLNCLFVFALLTLIIIRYFTYSQLTSLIEANRWVNHSYEVIDKVDLSLYFLAEIESDQRAYLMSGNENFLKKIKLGIANLNKILEQAQSLTQDNAKQTERVREYSELIKERVSLFTEVIELKEKNSMDTPKGLTLINRSSEISSRAKNLGQEIKAIEEILLTDRNNLTIGSAQRSSIFLIIGAIFSTIFLIIPFVLANIELNNRKIIEDKNRNTRIHLRQIIESTTDMIAALDAQNRFEIFNEAYQREFKRLFDKSLIIGMSMDEALSNVPQDKHKLAQIWKKSLKSTDIPLTMEFEDDHNPSIYELHAREIKNEINETQGLVHNVRDITSKVQEHYKLQDSYKKLSEGMKVLEIKNEQITLLVDMSDIMLAANSQEELTKIMSKFAESLLSFGSGCLFIMHPSKNYLEKSAHWGSPHPQESVILPNQCWGIRLGRLHLVKKKDRSLICEHLKGPNKSQTTICVPLIAQNDIYGLLYLEIADSTFILDNEARIILTAFCELTALALANVRLRENLHFQSIRDPLTGLYNRRYMEDALFKQLHQAQRSKFPCSLLMMDIDHFKKINDNYGHDAGDLALSEVGKLLENSIRHGDIAARYGGEEFLIMLHNTAKDEAKKRSEQIRLAVAELHMKYGAQPLSPLSISIGISSFPEDSMNREELIESADKALYAAKKMGRNKVVVFSEIKKEIG